MTTPAQLELLRHTLGLNRNQAPSRNYFMTDAASSGFADLIALTEAGLMAKSINPEWLGGGFNFSATVEGRAYAVGMQPAPKKKSRYEEFLDSDCGYSFAEWLGIDVPRREYSRGRYQIPYSHSPRDMVRLTSERGTGEWATTLKEAKANYKNAIRTTRFPV
ncbi:MAG: hypothetical protein Q7K26_01975 [bacterium]|nr:hypothetical protein [bacterium]